MSLFTITAGVLSLKPRIEQRGARLTFKSTWLYKLCYLFAISREVTMDRSKRLVTIYRRSWWFVRRFDIVSYDSIEDFGFWSKDLPQFCASEPFWGDKYEYVWLVLKIRDRDDLVRLISFEGEGSKETGLLGVVLGDSIFDFRGDHVEAAYDAKAMVESALSR